MSITRYCRLRYQKNLKDPYARKVESILEDIISNTNKASVVENLPKFDKHYSKNGLTSVIRKSTLDVRTFLKIMLASDVKEFTIKITDDEIKTFLEYETNRKN